MSKKDKKKFSIVIVGAGNIASGYDNPKSDNILTQAHAFKLHPRTELLGFYDIDLNKAIKASKKWSCRAFSNFNEIIEIRPDIISVCVPDQHHFSVLKEIIKNRYKPKIVICEKPITTDINHTKEIIRIYKKMKIPILVDYPRRFNSTINKISRNIKQGKYGRVICSSAIYTKGILHNGSHVIDMARYFFGNAISCRTLYSLEEYKNNFDRTIGAFIEFDGCPQFYLMAGDESKYSVFEFDVLCERKRLRFNDFGFYLEEQDVKKDLIYPDYKILSKQKIVETETNGSLHNMICNAVQYLESKDNLMCDINDAFETQKICFSLLNNDKL